MSNLDVPPQPDLFLQNGAISVHNLHVVWTTSNTIRWHWARQGEESLFQAYELVVGKSALDVRARNNGAVIWTGAQNPELGHFTLPQTNGNDPVVMVMTDQHQAYTLYFAQLTAIDTDGKKWESNVAEARTTAVPGNEIVLFSEDPTSGYSIPGTVEHKTDPSRAYDGQHYYEYTSSCNTGVTQCWENIRRQGIAKFLTPITENDFDNTAFFEIAVACEGAHSYYSHARLMFVDAGQAGSNSTTWSNAGWSIRCDNSYRLIQIPLRELGGTTTIPFAEISRELTEFGIGGAWSHGARIRIDEARVRW